jgi:hypothetical protein
MRIKLVKKLFVLSLTTLILLSIFSAGCFGDIEQLPVSSTAKFAALLVPDNNLELYIYTKQERSTIIPAKIINMSRDIKVESLAIWGLPSDKSLVFGAGLTFATASDASEIFSGIAPEKNGWKILRDNKIYVVQGTGVGAEFLKSAILNNGFKYYSDGNVLETVAMLPRGGKTKMVAVGVAKPSQQVLDLTADRIGKRNFDQVNKVLKLLNPDVVIGGLYSPNQINISRVVEVFEKGSGVSALDVGILVLIRSGLPGFVAEPVARNFLTDCGFTGARIGEFTLYKGFWSAPGGSDIPVLVRIEGNRIFAAISGQESYAEALITSIYK